MYAIVLSLLCIIILCLAHSIWYYLMVLFTTNIKFSRVSLISEVGHWTRKEHGKSLYTQSIGFNACVSVDKNIIAPHNFFITFVEGIF